jgi:hypothetical protein
MSRPSQLATASPRTRFELSRLCAGFIDGLHAALPESPTFESPMSLPSLRVGGPREESSEPKRADSLQFVPATVV